MVLIIPISRRKKGSGETGSIPYTHTRTKKSFTFDGSSLQTFPEYGGQECFWILITDQKRRAFGEGGWNNRAWWRDWQQSWYIAEYYDYDGRCSITGWTLEDFSPPLLGLPQNAITPVQAMPPFLPECRAGMGHRHWCPAWHHLRVFHFLSEYKEFSRAKRRRDC